MTRTIAAAALAELSKPAVQLALLAALEFDGGAVRVWSGIGSLTWNAEEYSGVGHLGEIAPIEESGQQIRANALSLRLSGIPSALLSIALSAEYQGRRVRIWLAFFDATFVASAILTDPILLFDGRMDVMQIDEGPQTSIITISAESRLADLKRPRVRRYTDQDQKQLYPGDRGLEFVTSLQNAEIVWGPGSLTTGGVPATVSEQSTGTPGEGGEGPRGGPESSHDADPGGVDTGGGGSEIA